MYDVIMGLVIGCSLVGIAGCCGCLLVAAVDLVQPRRTDWDAEEIMRQEG